MGKNTFEMESLLSQAGLELLIPCLPLLSAVMTARTTMAR